MVTIATLSSTDTFRLSAWSSSWWYEHYNHCCRHRHHNYFHLCRRHNQHHHRQRSTIDNQQSSSICESSIQYSTSGLMTCNLNMFDTIVPIGSWNENTHTHTHCHYVCIILGMLSSISTTDTKATTISQHFVHQVFTIIFIAPTTHYNILTRANAKSTPAPFTSQSTISYHIFIMQKQATGAISMHQKQLHQKIILCETG